MLTPAGRFLKDDFGERLLISRGSTQPGASPILGLQGNRIAFALVAATVESGDVARAQVYGVFSTGDRCVAARHWYMKQSLDEFRAVAVLNFKSSLHASVAIRMDHLSIFRGT
jgi:hypothetical protein